MCAFDILQENMSKHNFTWLKRTTFFGLTLTLKGKVYFGYENIWKECAQDNAIVLCLQTDAFSRINTMFHGTGMPQSPQLHNRSVTLPLLTRKAMPTPCRWKSFIPISCLALFGVFIFYGRSVITKENTY